MSSGTGYDPLKYSDVIEDSSVLTGRAQDVDYAEQVEILLPDSTITNLERLGNPNLPCACTGPREKPLYVGTARRFACEFCWELATRFSIWSPSPGSVTPEVSKHLKKYRFSHEM